MKEEFVEKAETFGNLQVEGQNLTSYMQSFVDLGSELQTEEMATRIQLSQRYGGEFLSTDEAAKLLPEPKAEVLSGESLQGVSERTEKALIGHKISIADTSWTFDGPGEFRSFDIVHGTNYGEIADYEVLTDVKGASGTERKYRLLLTFQRKGNGAEDLFFIKPLSVEKLAESKTANFWP